LQDEVATQQRDDAPFEQRVGVGEHQMLRGGELSDPRGNPLHISRFEVSAATDSAAA